jgi:hypothetical protein
MGKGRERQIILNTDQRDILLEMGLGGKFQTRSNGRDENRIFLEGVVLEVAVRNGRWVLCHICGAGRYERSEARQDTPQRRPSANLTA